jgi:O-antigen ligase
VSFVATFVLVFLSIFRPQEIWPALDAFHLLDVVTALAALGVGLDFALRRTSHTWSPQLPFLAAFLGISYVAAVKALGSQGVSIATTRALIAAVFMLVLMYGTKTFGQLRALVTLVSVLCVVVSAVAVDQSRRPFECIEIAANEADAPENGLGTPDGRTCEFKSDCYKGGRGDVDYACEELGLFKTVTVNGRVRWRGQLGDPNEMSVFIGAVIPLVLAMAAATKRWLAMLLAALLIGLGIYAVILSKSRGGQLVLGTVFAVYFYRRYGWKGIAVGALLALPVILLGGREATDSSDERIDLLYDGMTYVMHHPVLGMGIDQFGEMRGHTAHNAYLLAAAELGIPGLFAWSGLLWASVKIPLAVLRDPPPELPPEIRALANALVVSFVGMAVGIFFLSFTFKQLLFLWLGMCGALYGVVRRLDDRFEVRVDRRDYIGIAAFDVLVLLAIYVYTRVKAA